MESPLDSPPGSNNNNMNNFYDSEGGRGCRNKRKQSNPTFCPVCKCTLRPTDVDQHLNCELEKLQKMSKTRSNRQYNTAASSASGPSRTVHNIPSSPSSAPAPSGQPSGEHYRKYKQVRNNRKSRQKAKCQRRKLNNGSSTSANIDDGAVAGPSNVFNFDESSHGDLQCPICNCYKTRTEITTHVDDCLTLLEQRNKRRRSSMDSTAIVAGATVVGASCSRPDILDESSLESSTEDEGEGEGAHGDDEVDVESLSFGEYEWAGQVRVRATSLVPGGVCTLISSANHASGTSNLEDADEDLVVDDDDCFGPAQYAECDMIHCESDMRRERGEEILRRAVLTPIIQCLPTVEVRRHSGRSKSEERTENEDRQSERAEVRHRSDPFSILFPDNRPPSVPEEVLHPSDYIHMYPITVRESVPTSGNDTAASFETVPSPQPPELVPVDLAAPVAVDSDSSRPAPILQPANGFLQHRHEPLMIDIERLDAERLLVPPGPIEMHPAALLNLIPSLTTWNTVPSLSAMAQNVATRANITGANPIPSTSGTQVSESINKMIIKSLMDKIKDLENRLDGDIYKCLICMDRYRTPVISTTCWHVHCEECWLRTLGVKKLCPQCNAITTPIDLRKIFI